MAHINFSASHSRNGHDFTYQESEDGRHLLLADGDGVKKRIGLLVTAMGRNGAMTKKEAVAYLQDNFHSSYNVNDLQQPFKVMLKHGIAHVSGRGPVAKYRLTTRGRQIWENADKEWVHTSNV